MTLPLLLLFAVAPPPSAEASGLAWLAREAPAWRRDNGCFSCHHDGDAARALLAARRPISAATLDFLSHPERWAKNGGEGPFNDPRLARLQFAAALADAGAAGLVKRRAAATEAAKLVAAMQADDGSWPVVPDGDLGGATTYGNALATRVGRDALRKLDAGPHKDAIAKAEKWMRSAAVDSVPDAAALIDAGPTQRKKAVALLRDAEAKSGGWGPYAKAPPEVFDTALVLLAIADEPALRPMARRGRAFLVASREPGGSWPETTRPGGGSSVSQRASTTAWAVLALLRTRGVD